MWAEEELKDRNTQQWYSGKLSWCNYRCIKKHPIAETQS